MYETNRKIGNEVAQQWAIQQMKQTYSDRKSQAYENGLI